MLSFFRKKSESPSDYSLLGADMHAHLLPGIDDGAKDPADSVALISGLIDLGYHSLTATPHVISDIYPNSRDAILRKRDDLIAYFDKTGIHLPPFTVAAEYMLDETFAEKVKTEPLLTLPGNHVLLEMPLLQAYPDLHAVIFDLQMKGYKPILAHPERYQYYRHADDFARLKEMGCLLQVNLLSLTGYYNPGAKASARLLLSNGMIDFLGTDIHHVRHLEHLKSALDEERVGEAIQSVRGNRLLHTP